MCITFYLGKARRQNFPYCQCLQDFASIWWLRHLTRLCDLIYCMHVIDLKVTSLTKPLEPFSLVFRPR